MMNLITTAGNAVCSSITGAAEGELARTVEELRKDVAQLQCIVPLARHTLNGMKYGSEASTTPSRHRRDSKLRIRLIQKYSRGRGAKPGLVFCMGSGMFVIGSAITAGHLYKWCWQG